MKLVKHTLLLTVLLLNACQPTPEQKLTEKSENLFELDHLIVMVNDSSLQKTLSKSLTHAHLLSSDHGSQGTRGEYFLFMNSFLELLYVKDSSAIMANETLFGSNYLAHWNYDDGLPFGIGLRLKNLKDTVVLKDAYRYVPDSNSPEHFYWMAASNSDPHSPLIFVVNPGAEHQVYSTIEEIQEKVDPRIVDDLIHFQQHPLGVLHIDGLHLHWPTAHQNLDWLEKTEGFKIMQSTNRKAKLYFESDSLSISID